MRARGSSHPAARTRQLACPRGRQPLAAPGRPSRRSPRLPRRVLLLRAVPPAVCDSAGFVRTSLRCAGGLPRFLRLCRLFSVKLVLSAPAFVNSVLSLLPISLLASAAGDFGYKAQNVSRSDRGGVRRHREPRCSADTRASCRVCLPSAGLGAGAHHAPPLAPCRTLRALPCPRLCQSRASRRISRCQPPPVERAFFCVPPAVSRPSRRRAAGSGRAARRALLLPSVRAARVRAVPTAAASHSPVSKLPNTESPGEPAGT